MKNILLLVHDDPGQEARVQAALDLTRALEGHLTCLDVSVMPVIPGDFYAATAETGLLADECEREAENRARLEARLAHEGVSWNWVDLVGTFSAALNEAAKMADLVVVNRLLDSAIVPDMRQVASEVVVGSGKAVVAVPEAARAFVATGLALVAWDGSDEAMNALRAAVPLLKLARAVVIVEIVDGSVDTPAEEAAAYLSRHDIHPLVKRRSRGSRSVAEAIIAEARDRQADYVVMGGFGHSRFVEALFGGVSREMLTDSPIPLVMAH
jgi:nucleotide-binding universal stress UspA family protein